MKFNVKALSISFFFVSFYVVSCYYWSHNITISRDTKVYYDAYLNIVNVANPFGVEFVLSLIMNICNFLGMTFRELLLVLLLLWTPVICFLSYNSKKYPILIFASLFFFIYQFNETALFLIRSYLSVLFFFLFIVSNRYLKIIFAVLSFFSQVTSILFLITYNKVVYNMLLKDKRIALFLMFFSIICSFFIGYVLLGKINFDFLYGVFPDVINRKLSFYNGLENIGGSNLIIIGLSVFLGFLIISTKVNEERKRFDAFVFSQVIICILFSNINILSNRLGIVAFMFSIPIICFYMKEKS